MVSGVPGGCLHQSHTCSCVAGETCGSRMKIFSAGSFQVRLLELREGGLLFRELKDVYPQNSANIFTLYDIFCVPCFFFS